MTLHPFDPLRNLTYDDFRRMALDEGLSSAEKIGFPDQYRNGYLDVIWNDICNKLNIGPTDHHTMMDIGPGCGELGVRVAEWGISHTKELLLMDAPEVLSKLPFGPGLIHQGGRFPEDAGALLETRKGSIDRILCYSVLHYIFPQGNIYSFLDHAISLLAHGGRMLLGDIPNTSMLKRFLDSPEGARYHRNYTGRDEDPVVCAHHLNPGRMDDGVLAALVQRCQSAGCHAYRLPQPPSLPMANRREDLLIIRP